jgi:hypothetical protein
MKEYFSFLTIGVKASVFSRVFSIGFPCSRAVLNSEKQSDKNA